MGGRNPKALAASGGNVGVSGGAFMSLRGSLTAYGLGLLKSQEDDRRVREQDQR
jgi:hypothetical protein